MDFNIQFTYDQVVDIISQMPEPERQRLKKEVLDTPSGVDNEAIDKVIESYHSKYEKTYQALA